MPRHTRAGTSETTLREKFRATIAADEPPCHLCGQPIDYSIRDHRDPMAFQIDHIIPRSKGGPNLLENLAAAHRKCNRERGDKPLHPPGVIFVTERRWW